RRRRTAGRWGEKVPTTVGTISHRLALLEPSAADGQGPCLALQRALPSAVRARLRRPQPLGLLFQTGLQGSLGQAFGRRLGHLFHGIEIDVRPRPGVAEGAAGDNSAPWPGEATEFWDFLGSKRVSRHSAFGAGVK